MLMNTVCGKVLRSHSSGRQRYTHSCELTSLEQRKAAPIFLSVSLISKLSLRASLAAALMASEHSVSPFDMYEHKYVTHL